MRSARGELRAVVDAEHLALRADDDPRLQSLLARKLNDISEVIFALGVVGADVPQQFQRPPPVDRHQSGVAQRDRALRVAGVFFFSYGDQPSRVVADQAPVTKGICGFETQRRDRRAVLERRAKGQNRRGRHERRVGEEDQNVVMPPRDRVAGGQNRMGGAKPLFLHENFRAPRKAWRPRRAHPRGRVRRRPRCRRPSRRRRSSAHAPASSVRRSHAKPSGDRISCACPRRRRGQWRGRFGCLLRALARNNLFDLIFGRRGDALLPAIRGFRSPGTPALVGISRRPRGTAGEMSRPV